MTQVQVRPRTHVPLIEGHLMICPRCRDRRSVIAFDRLAEVEAFASQTMPIYRCPKVNGGCGWVFSPAPDGYSEHMNRYAAVE
jgi:hypothetical protein